MIISACVCVFFHTNTAGAESWLGCQPVDEQPERWQAVKDKLELLWSGGQDVVSFHSKMPFFVFLWCLTTEVFLECDAHVK